MSPGKVCATCSANEFLRGLYAEGLFIGPRHAAYLAKCGFRFLKAYMWLATASYERKLPRFPFQPKFHYVHHLVWDLQQYSSQRIWALNPICTSVQMQEDLVGRVARVSRRVSPITVSLRTLERVQLAARAAFKRDAEQQLER